MSRRFVIMACLWVMLMLLLFSEQQPRTLIDVFFALFALLVVMGVALWPTMGRDKRVEMRMERANWADRIEFQDKK
jgi:uncharacterized membrane protein YccF (DUF307 family)